MRKRLIGPEDGVDRIDSTGTDGATGRKEAKILPSQGLCHIVLVAAAVSFFILLLIITLRPSNQDVVHHSSETLESDIAEMKIKVAEKRGSNANVRGDPCQSYDADYFSNLMGTVEKMSLNASLPDGASLCDANRLQHRTCRCRNPFIPISQDLTKVKNWHQCHQMNIDLMEGNYTSRNFQPEVVLYGDSITERLLGRMFGKGGPKMQEFMRDTERVFTKEGGGAINGLPLGISSDEVSSV